MEALTALSNNSPRANIASAQRIDPTGADFAQEICTMIGRRIEDGASAASTYILVAAALGYTVGGMIDTRRAGSGYATECLIEALNKVLSFSSEAGFAETKKEQENG